MRFSFYIDSKQQVNNDRRASFLRKSVIATRLVPRAFDLDSREPMLGRVNASTRKVFLNLAGFSPMCCSLISNL